MKTAISFGSLFLMGSCVQAGIPVSPCSENFKIRVAVGAIVNPDCLTPPFVPDVGVVAAFAFGDYSSCRIEGGGAVISGAADSFGPAQPRRIGAGANTLEAEPFPEGLHAGAEAGVWPQIARRADDPQINAQLIAGGGLLTTDQWVGAYRAQCSFPCGFGVAQASASAIIELPPSACPMFLRVIAVSLVGPLEGLFPGVEPRDRWTFVSVGSGAGTQTTVYGGGTRDGAFVSNVSGTTVVDYSVPTGMPVPISTLAVSFEPASLDLNANGKFDLVDVEIVRTRYVGQLAPNASWARLFANMIVDVAVLDHLALLFGASAMPGLYPPTPCSVADLANTDGDSGPDGTVDNGDFSFFILAFTGLEMVADIASTDGETLPLFGGTSLGGPDGQLDNGDFDAFFASFFDGC